jgi:ssDNA-binding replication factor A large subunit
MRRGRQKTGGDDPHGFSARPSWADVESAMPESRPPATFISDLRPSRVATIEATVRALEPVREVEVRDGASKKVRNGMLQDRTGEIAFVLWGSEVDLVDVGDHVRIVEGWVADRRGRPQISLGRTGRIEKLPPG